MESVNEALVGPNPRDEIIQEIAKIKEKQRTDFERAAAQRERDSFEWATKELARRYFKLDSLQYFDSKKLESLQDLIYEKARRAYMRHTILLALTPIIGWMALLIRRTDDVYVYNWPTRKFVKYYKKFRKKEEDKK